MIASTARHRSRQIQATVSLHQLFQILIFGLLEKIIIEMLGILVTALINTSYLTDSYIGFTLKMESVTKNTIFLSVLEKFILKSLHAGW